MEENSVDKNIFNAYNGGQVIVANDHATVYAVQNNGNASNIIHQPVKSRTQEYADNWDANMFLNDFDKRDENAGVNVKLSEVYLEEHLPHYTWKDSDKLFTDLKQLLSEYIIEKRNNKMLLILGQPGIGKSTLITWLVAYFNSRINDILVYKFSSDLMNVDWHDSRMSKRILEELSLSYDDLNGKTLILDGFDEISIESDRRRDILDGLYGDWIYNKAIDKFSLIITCRENYVQRFAILNCKYIILQPWNRVQIQSFCNVFQEKSKNNISGNTIEKIIEKKKILGIPLILYMVLALNISLEQESSIVDVYDKIFSLEGGIYDRCIDNKMFADKHRIAEVKKQIHQISRQIAIWMFENNPDEASIPQEEYKKICFDVKKKSGKENEEIDQDFLIGNYFKLVRHCEGIGTEQLCFVHRSIYEYFVAEAICNSIENAILKLTQESQEELAENIAFYLKKGKITYTIGKNLQYKMYKIYYMLSYEKKEIFYKWWEEAVSKMMTFGMFYKTKNCIKNHIDQELRCFANCIKILQLILEIEELTEKKGQCGIKQKSDYRKYIGQYIKTEELEKYIKYCLVKKEHISLNNFSLKGMDLSGFNFRDIDLRNAALDQTNLMRANLYGAFLEGIDFSKSCIIGAILNTYNLEQVYFSEDQIKDLEKYYYLEKVNIYVVTEKAILSYIEYKNKET